MFVFSQDKTGFVNSDRITSFFVDSNLDLDKFSIMADGIYLASYNSIKEAKKEIENIHCAIAQKQTSYQIDKTNN